MQPDLRVKMMSVDKLLPYARNARTHSEAQVAQIAASITTFGFVNPVLIDQAGEIIAGHGRVLAAVRLGMTEVPTIRLGHLTPEQVRAFRIADNKLPLNAGWDELMLRLELIDLEALGVDLGVLGFEAADLAELMADKSGGLSEADEAPAPPVVATTRLGDLWLCGEHRVLCGDATEREAFVALMGRDRAVMAFTDPPYNVDYANTAEDKKRGTGRAILNDALGTGFGKFLAAACANLLEFTNGGVYICMSSSELDTLQSAFRGAGGKWSTFLIWAKNTFTLGRSDYHRQYEPILYGWRDGAEHFWSGARNQGDVWFFDKPHVNDLHPTMKPVGLVERAIGNSSQRSAIVLDPFGGSGTTLIAAHRTGRRARVIELDPRYVDVIVARWQTFAGQEATLDGDKRTFRVVAKERAKAAA